MEIDLAPVGNLLPWLAVASPLVGLFMRWIRGNTTVAGFGVIGVGTAIAVLTVGALGLALGWDQAQWKGAPLGVLFLVGGSVLTDQLATHTREKIEAKRNGSS